MPKPTVLIVDDTKFYRDLIAQILTDSGEFTVIGTAPDPYVARQMIKQLQPNLLTLDVEMPGMDGLSFLEKIMTLRPMPVVMVSTLTASGTATTIEALGMGAVECLAKPHDNQPETLEHFAKSLLHNLHIASQVKLRPVSVKPAMHHQQKIQLGRHAPKVIGIGSSTGGVEALGELFRTLPEGLPPIVITQHMPVGFTKSFAERITRTCTVPLIEATPHLELKAGQAYLAPGGKQFKIKREGQGWVTEVNDDPPVNLHKPAVDVLFHSIAKEVGASAFGVILTGMGRDGAAGLLAMREAGANTIGQDEASCVVYGMPKAAFEVGAVAQQLPLESITSTLVQWCRA